MANATKNAKRRTRTSDSEKTSGEALTKTSKSKGGDSDVLQSEDLPSSSTEKKETESSLEEDITDDGIKLGLGDFVFYNLLVGTSCEHEDLLTVLACIISILVGLSFTLAILAIRRHALPALPISIFLGIIANFSTAYMSSPMATALASRQIFA